MLNENSLAHITPETAAAYARELTPEDVSILIERLGSKEDAVRYPALLLLRARSALSDDVYPYWDLLVGKLPDANSYQRSIGAMLLAANARWDSKNQMRACLPQYLALLNDEKPITVRQCVQSLAEICAAQPSLAGEISAALIRVDLTRIKETMRKLVLADILETLLAIRAAETNTTADEFIFSALSGEILDDKLKKKFRAQM